MDSSQPAFDDVWASLARLRRSLPVPFRCRQEELVDAVITDRVPSALATDRSATEASPVVGWARWCDSRKVPSRKCFFVVGFGLRSTLDTVKPPPAPLEGSCLVWDWAASREA